MSGLAETPHPSEDPRSDTVRNPQKSGVDVWHRVRVHSFVFCSRRALRLRMNYSASRHTECA